jgi:hypothetical protein
LLILALMLNGWLVSSCKKDNEQSSITSFLTGDRVWRLASMQVQTLHGDTLKRTDTLNTDCEKNQTFSFNSNGSSTYEDYCCRDQTSTGTWQMTTQDSIMLKVNMVCEDTTKIGRSKPFANTQVINLGQNSLILRSVKIDTFRKTPVVVLRRKITTFGFIH